MRGKVLRPAAFSPEEGITPAYAGKSDARSNRRRVRRDHPRVCGEKSSTSPMKCLKLGSPPRMRGKAGIFLCRPEWSRITPAYAGKRNTARQHRRSQRDHPRVCGEKFSLPLFLDLPQGSPPRMRGKDALVGFGSGNPGITPAYAGKSSTVFPAASALRDHPRVCGEKRRLKWAVVDH